MQPLKKVLLGRPIGRRLVIPDIHGCYNTLYSLIQQIELSQDDQLFFLGDYVNKGIRSPETLDFLIDLNERFRDIHFILGNHDLAILNHFTGEVLQTSGRIKSWSSENLITHPNQGKYIRFFESLVYYIELDDYLLVHAGFDFSKPEPFSNRNQMLNIVGGYNNITLTKGKTIVHGHLPHPLNDIESNIRSQKDIIPLDNGCIYFGERKGHGRLLCFDLDSRELIMQSNID